MRKMIVASMLVGAVVLVAGRAQAADTMIDGLKKACNKELTTFLQGRESWRGAGSWPASTPSRTRSRTSAPTPCTTPPTSSRLPSRPSSSPTTQCKDDLLKYCGDVEAGQGRGLACLKKNDKERQPKPPWEDALKATGLKK